MKRAENPLPVAKDMLELITTKIQVEPESCCKLPTADINPLKNTSTLNSFIEAVHTAYAEHYPLVLSPDIIWQCVAQGFAIHVNKNARKLRHKFVAHNGKIKLVVQMDSFVKGSPDNDWEQAFRAFSDEVRKNVGDEIHGLLTPDFSTTGPVEKAESQIVLMNTFKEYFDYSHCTECGIPSITMEGNVEDWKRLCEKALSLSRFNFRWWTDAVKPILNEFVNALSGVVNKKFWQKLYKLSHDSGGPYITGWIATLFPYLGSKPEKMQQNEYLRSWNNESREMFYGITTTEFPSGAVSTPFIRQYFAEKFEMCFYAGFYGVGQDKKTLALKPVIGWAVAEDDTKEEVENTIEQNGGCCRCC